MGKTRDKDLRQMDAYYRNRCAVCNQPIMYVRVRNRWRWLHLDKTIRHKVQR